MFVGVDFIHLREVPQADTINIERHPAAIGSAVCIFAQLMGGWGGRGAERGGGGGASSVLGFLVVYFEPGIKLKAMFLVWKFCTYQTVTILRTRFSPASRLFSCLPKGGRRFWCLPLSRISRLSVWSHFSISPLLFFWLVLWLSLPGPVLLLAHSPDSFSLNLHFPKGRLLLLFFEQLGDEYFSWWYVLYAFI